MADVPLIRPVQFGYFPQPAADGYADLVYRARLVDKMGLDFIGIQDHPYQRRFFDTWTLLAALAVQTEHVRFFPNVTNLPMRPPAMLAKAVASLDVMTGGRIELGLGAGFYWKGIVAMGGPERTPGEAVDAVEEAIQILRMMWRGERGARFDGEFYRLQGANAGPVPAHPVAIYLGAIQRRMLGLTGRYCDGWVPSSPYVPPEELDEKNGQIDAAAEAAGRDPGAIRRIYNLLGTITDGARGDYLEGPVDYWVDELTSLALDHRMDTLIFGPSEDTEAQLRRFGEEVVPQVREQVAA